MTSASAREIRIGGAAGYWGDSQQAPKQLLDKGDVDYLVFDYLSEVTMSILVRAKQKTPDLGYARDFVELVMKPLLPEIKAKGVKVVVNAGGVNIAACADALRKVAADQGLSLKVGIVEGDDILDQVPALKAEGTREMFQDKEMPDRMISANAYLGAFPIAAALSAGAEVVITGRCVDSAVTLGPLIHEFGWQTTDFDKLAAGSLAGHIVECGAQATGGNFTDWKEVADGWDDMGYPIAVCRSDGSFAITKPDGTGGRVSRLTVGEQILYEIGDPAAYILPDVICDFTAVTLTETKRDWLEVDQVMGRAPTSTYKVSATYPDGYRATAATLITGFDAADKGQAFMDSLIKRTRRLFEDRKLGDYRGISTHLVGADTLWGQNAAPDARSGREVMARLDVRHDAREALELFSKETTGVALSMTTGRCSAGAAGRPKITPVVAQFAFQIAKDRVQPTVSVNGETIPFQTLASSAVQDDVTTSPPEGAVSADFSEPLTEVDLLELAVARSGDKGNNANIGVMARKDEYLPYIRAALEEEAVAKWFAHVVTGPVHRYDLPGMKALNFVLIDCLDGGGTSSLHLDNMGKTYGQQILAMKVKIPADLV